MAALPDDTVVYAESPDWRLPEQETPDYFGVPALGKYADAARRAGDHEAKASGVEGFVAPVTADVADLDALGEEIARLMDVRYAALLRRQS